MAERWTEVKNEGSDSKSKKQRDKQDSLTSALRFLPHFLPSLVTCDSHPPSSSITATNQGQWTWTYVFSKNRESSQVHCYMYTQHNTPAVSPLLHAWPQRLLQLVLREYPILLSLGIQLTTWEPLKNDRKWEDFQGYTSAEVQRSWQVQLVVCPIVGD